MRTPVSSAQAATSQCAMSVLGAPGDVPFLRLIIEHLKRSARYSFSEVILVLDTSPSARYPAGSTGILSLRKLGDDLRRDGVVDKVVSLADEEEKIDQLARRHFARQPPRRRDHRGIPMFGWILGLESTVSPYVFHADSDVLVHSRSARSWIDDGIALLESDQTAMFVAPRPGPPSEDGTLFGQLETALCDTAGNFRFKEFSSRRFLVRRAHYEALLPLGLQHWSQKRRLLMALGGRSALLPWETHVDRALTASPYWYVHLGGKETWTLHSPDHGAEWQSRLPMIIDAVERGEYPRGQAGKYDLILDEWRQFVVEDRGDR